MDYISLYLNIMIFWDLIFQNEIFVELKNKTIMKKTIFRPTAIIAIFSFILLGCGGSSEVNNDTIFANIDNTENYEILELASMDQQLSTFVEMVDLADLAWSVEFADPVTVFIPTNEAFAEMSVERLAYLKDPENKAELVRFVSRHILPTEVPMVQFNTTQIIETASEEEITVSTALSGNVVYVGGAEIVKGDIPAANGMIHIVSDIIEQTTDVVAD